MGEENKDPQLVFYFEGKTKTGEELTPETVDASTLVELLSRAVHTVKMLNKEMQLEPIFFKVDKIAHGSLEIRMAGPVEFNPLAMKLREISSAATVDAVPAAFRATRGALENLAKHSRKLNAKPSIGVKNFGNISDIKIELAGAKISRPRTKSYTYNSVIYGKVVAISTGRSDEKWVSLVSDAGLRTKYVVTDEVLGQAKTVFDKQVEADVTYSVSVHVRNTEKTECSLTGIRSKTVVEGSLLAKMRELRIKLRSEGRALSAEQLNTGND
jgi:hypothetical protein